MNFFLGLLCVPNHWPCLDNLITALYAFPNYMGCLIYISKSLQRDPTYIKALAFREAILKKVPCLWECYKFYNEDWELDPPLDVEFDQVFGSKLVSEAEEIANSWSEFCKPAFELKPLPDLNLRKPVTSNTWLELGKSLVDMHEFMYENQMNFVSRIILTKETPEIEEPKMEVEKVDLNQVEEVLVNGKVDMEVEEEDKKSSSDDLQIIEEDDVESEEKTKEPEEEKEKKEEKTEEVKVKKKRRTSLSILQQWSWCNSSTRRSSRVRSSRKDSDVQLEDSLRRLFPSDLWVIEKSKDEFKDDSMDTSEMFQMFSKETTTDGTQSSSNSKPTSPYFLSNKYFGTEEEKTDVDEFLKLHSGKSNLMVIIAKFTEFLAIKWTSEFPEELQEVFLKSYQFTREHIPHKTLGDEEESILQFDAEMTLLYCELFLDNWLKNKPEKVPHSSMVKLGVGLPSEELGFVIFASCRDDLNDSMFLYRMLWLKAHLFLCQGDIEITTDSLDLLVHYMRKAKVENNDIFLKLVNCKHNNLISLKVVERMLLSIQRGQKLSEIQNLNKENNYEALALILQETFKYGKQANR